jgi:NAD(P)-dependent dehydrogenase (short-subunit alcohol dehydrogenase family)
VSGGIVIGAGPGIGLSVARRLAREGMPVAVLARSASTVRAATEAIPGALGITADATDETALRAALDEAVARHGVPDVLVYNAAWIRADRAGELSAQGHLDAWAVNVVGAITAAGHLAPRMAERGSGTIILTGGMPEAKPEVLSLSLGKAGIRALTEALATEYGPAGVHVATVTVYGVVAPGTAFDPDEIAERYWELHRQPRPQWQREVAHTGT